MIGDEAEPWSLFGLPPDFASWTAVALALTLLVMPQRQRAGWANRSWWSLLGLAAAGALLSLAYFHTYLGGAPRIIDASTYLQEARTFASGAFSFAVPEPSSLFRGRFLLNLPGAARRLAPIFPPGYPALLSLGVRLGDYRLVGPVLAFALTLSTAWLAFEVTRMRKVALLAATLSVLCAAARYHTADTMSHGLSAVLATLALTASVRMLRPQDLAAFAWREALLLGLALGSLCATRQLTAIAVGAASMLPLLSRPAAHLRRKPLAVTGLLLLGAAPGLLLLAAHNHALTGSALGSPQLAYYAASDGPPGCFRLGLGGGCHVEHGDVVSAQGGKGLTVPWMLKNTLHRLHWHSLDVANWEALWLLPWFWLYRERRRPAAWPLVIAGLLLPLAYSFFYFQGSYPGGGARFFFELVPAMQAATAALLCDARRVRAGLIACLLGFAFHAVHLHRRLPGHGGLPTPLGTAADGTDVAGTDRAFNLLFDPSRSAQTGRPSAIRVPVDSRKLVPLPAGAELILEAEADWPVLEQRALWSHPEHVGDRCVRGGRALSLHFLKTHVEPGLRLDFSGVAAGEYSLEAWFWSPRRGCFRLPLGVARLPANVDIPPWVLMKSADRAEAHLDYLRATILGQSVAPHEKKR